MVDQSVTSHADTRDRDGETLSDVQSCSGKPPSVKQQPHPPEDMVYENVTQHNLVHGGLPLGLTLFLVFLLLLLSPSNLNNTYLFQDFNVPGFNSCTIKFKMDLTPVQYNSVILRFSVIVVCHHIITIISSVQ